MIEAVIVATALTPIRKADRGAFNDTQGQALAGHAIREAVARAGVERGRIDDVVVTDKASGEISRREATLSWDEGNRPQTRLEDLALLKPVQKDGRRITKARFITAESNT